MFEEKKLSISVLKLLLNLVDYKKNGEKSTVMKLSHENHRLVNGYYSLIS